LQFRFLKRINLKEAAKKAIEELEKIQGWKTNYRLRDAVFSSKILGEPFPVYYVNTAND
jgi:hypothetical protein